MPLVRIVWPVEYAPKKLTYHIKQLVASFYTCLYSGR